MTVEILTSTVNQIIQSFVKSKQEYIDDFFKEYLVKKFGQSSTKQRKFCFSLILSLLMLKEEHLSIELYYDILASEIAFTNYEFFWDLRSLCLSLKAPQNQRYANLDSFYINQKEYVFVLNQCLGYDIESISLFKDEMKELIGKIKQEKQQDISKICRGKDFNMTFFIREVCSRFVSELEKNLSYNSYEPTEYNRPTMFGYDHFTEYKPRRTQLRRNTKINNNLVEKDSLVKELKETIKMANAVKNSNIKMLAFFNEIEFLHGDIKEHCKIQRKRINELKNDLLIDNKRKAFDNSLGEEERDRLLGGSISYKSFSKKLNKTLISLDNEYYESLDGRREENTFIIRNLIKQTKNLQNNKNLQKIFSQTNLKPKLVKQLLNKEFNNRNELGLHEYMSLKLILEGVSNKKKTSFTIPELFKKKLNKTAKTIKVMIPGLISIDKQKPIAMKRLEEEVKANITGIEELKEQSEMINRVTRLTQFKHDPSNLISGKKSQLTLSKESETLHLSKTIGDSLFLKLNSKIDFDQLDKSTTQQIHKTEVSEMIQGENESILLSKTAEVLEFKESEERYEEQKKKESIILPKIKEEESDIGSQFNVVDCVEPKSTTLTSLSAQTHENPIEKEKKKDNFSLFEEPVKTNNQLIDKHSRKTVIKKEVQLRKNSIDNSFDEPEQDELSNIQEVTEDAEESRDEKEDEKLSKSQVKELKTKAIEQSMGITSDEKKTLANFFKSFFGKEATKKT